MKKETGMKRLIMISLFKKNNNKECDLAFKSILNKIRGYNKTRKKIDSLKDVSKFHNFCFWLICGYVIIVLCMFTVYRVSDVISISDKDNISQVVNDTSDSVLEKMVAGPPAPGTKEYDQLSIIESIEDNQEVPAIPEVLETQEESVVQEESTAEKKRVYLTFDDGPSNNTTAILDILRDNAVLATFFTVAKSGPENEAIYKRIVNEGHTLGMHSFSHKYNEIYSSVETFSTDVSRISEYIYNVTGYQAKYYRFPGGSATLRKSAILPGCISFLNEHNIKFFDWNALNGDAEGGERVFTEGELVTNIMNDVINNNTSVVLMHDADDKTTTVNSLPELIRQLRELDIEILPINDETPLIQQVGSSGEN